LRDFTNSCPVSADTGYSSMDLVPWLSAKPAKRRKSATAFSVAAWIAVDNYPWNWAPVVDYSLDQQSGFYFGVDAFGHLGLQASVDGIWQSLTSDARLQLKKWSHVAGTFDSAKGMFLYIDGKSVGYLEVHGKFRAASADWPVSNASLLAIRDAALLVGRVREPALPVPADSIHPRYPFPYSFDGLMDDVVIYDHALRSRT
jgi:concanavalin A-like lectin/glucanase superfamily protein